MWGFLCVCVCVFSSVRCFPVTWGKCVTLLSPVTKQIRFCSHLEIEVLWVQFIQIWIKDLSPDGIWLSSIFLKIWFIWHSYTLLVVGASTVVRKRWRWENILTGKGDKSFHSLFLFRQYRRLLLFAVVSLAQAQAYHGCQHMKGSCLNSC